jgi:ribosome-binding protein aMBF1 (putative translation factor)
MADVGTVMSKHHSPVGTSVGEHVERKLARSKSYRDAYERVAPFEQIARIAIMRRAQLGLSQQQVAERMGTTTSVISRIESGQHRTGTETLRRLAEALEGQAVLGFEFATDGEPDRELVAL